MYIHRLSNRLTDRCTHCTSGGFKRVRTEREYRMFSAILIFCICLKGSVFAEVVISPVNVSVSENKPVTLTCSLTGTTETPSSFSWYLKLPSQVGPAAVGVLTSSCQSVIVSINTSLYSYACSTRHSTWTIKKVTRENHGDRYQCQIAKASGVENSDYTFLNIQVPVSSVTMTVPSTGSVTVSENVAEEFQCKTSGGLPEATVTWYKDSGTPETNSDDKEISSNIQTSSRSVNGLIEVTSNLMYSPTRTENGWRIYCTASNANGQTSLVSQRKPLLNVQYPPDGPPVITGYNNGSEYRVIEGKQGQLFCSVSGGKPAATLTWDCINTGTLQINSSGGTVTGVYTWIALRGQDRTCTCKSSHYSGNSSVTIRIKILYPPTKPTFTIGSVTVSGIVKVIRHNSFSVNCSSSGQPEPSYKWTYQNTTISTGSLLRVGSVQNDERYTCQVQNTMDSSEGTSVPGSNSSFIDVSILYQPATPTFYYWNASGPDIPTRLLDVIKGDTFQVACISAGEPTPTYQWNNLRTNQILTVTSVTADRSDVCTATNTMEETVGETRHGSASATLNINVQYPPNSVEMKYHYGQSSMTTLTSSLSIIEGNPFEVTCSSVSNPTPSFRWTGSVSSPSARLQVNKTQRSQNGTLSCMVENVMTRTFANPEKKKHGTTNGSFHLNVLYPPVIGELNNASVVEGSPVTVSCPVTVGIPRDTTFEWRRNGQKWKETQDFTIETTSRKDAMYYTCKASNIMQQTGEEQVSQPDIKTFYLNVWYSTNVTEFYIVGYRGETTVTLNETDSVPFKCIADSNPGSNLSVLYKKDVKQSQTNTKLLEYSVGSAQCTDRGVYSCEGFNQYNVRHSTRYLTLFINCSPRPSPFVTLRENVTSAKHQQATLTFTTLAYPEPEVTDYRWYRWNESTWLHVADSEQFKVDTSHLQTNLTITSVKHSHFGMYRLLVENTYGLYEQKFHLLPEDVPDQPTGFSHLDELVTKSSVTVEWMPGSNNGLNQTFMLKYKQISEKEWMTVSIPHSKELTMNYTIHGLSSGTQYNVVLYAYNKLGNSSETEVLTVTTKGKDGRSQPVALIAGGVIGGLACAGLVVVIYFVVRKYRTRVKTDDRMKLPRSGVQDQDNDSSDDEVITENSLYVSAGPVGQKKPEIDNVYAKPQKKPIPRSDVYAVVNKTQTSKKSGQKKTLKLEKRKKGLKGDIYENAPATAAEKDKTYTNSAFNDSPYEIQDVDTTKLGKKNTNKDGLIYADLAFNDQPKGQKKLVIHGLDDMTEYVKIDFTKRADPLPDSDEETKK